MQAVIMAGGKGTRLETLTKGELPKPMVPILDKPLLEWQLEQLKRYSITKVTMIVGHLHQKIIDYFGNGSKFGCEIDYIIEEKPLGTAGAFYFLKDKLVDENFLLVFGDVFFDIDLNKMIEFHNKKNAEATLFAHPNSHPFDSDLIKSDIDGKVIAFDSKNNVRNYWYDNCVNAGMYVLNKSICKKIKEPIKTDFEKEILAVMAENGENVYAYKSPEYIKDVGTIERITKTIEEIKSGFIASRNLEFKQRAVFMDRDGTINKLKGFLDNENDFELEDCAVSAIGKINTSGMLAIVITNQPVVARGQCSIEDVENIHNKMKTLLGNKGVYLDDVIFCPHHPDKGFPEENPAYKIDCECRKPKTGMIMKAASKYNIDLSKSFMIGDTTMDLELGRRAGVKTCLVLTGEAGNDKKFSKESDFVAENLEKAVDIIL